MSRFAFPVLAAIGAVVLLAIALQLYSANWRLQKEMEKPPALVKACVWEAGRREKNILCNIKCGRAYPQDMPVEVPHDRKTYRYCCPTGYRVNLFTGPSATCRWLLAR